MKRLTIIMILTIPFLCFSQNIIKGELINSFKNKIRLDIGKTQLMKVNDSIFQKTSLDSNYIFTYTKGSRDTVDKLMVFSIQFDRMFFIKGFRHSDVPEFYEYLNHKKSKDYMKYILTLQLKISRKEFRLIFDKSKHKKKFGEREKIILEIY